ncbi:MAG: hypothetical protein IPO18_11260 [bacterium]|nr:hypothetical protein [bacterium]
MTTQRYHILTAALVLAAALIATARADLGPPVTVTLVGPSRPAEAGQRFDDTARFTAARDLVLSAVEIGTDPAWSVVSLVDPGPVPLAAGQHIDVPFAVIANDPDAAPLTFAFRFDDLPATADISLSPLAFAEGTVAHPTGAVDPDGAAAALAMPAGADLPRPGPSPGTGESGPPDAAAGTPDKAGRWITVHGRFFYQRPDLVLDGADGMTAEVYADGLKRAAVVTAPDGSYSATFFWVPATFWQDLNPDLRVEFVSDSAKVQTRNAAGFVLRWFTPTWPNFAGSDLDVGWQKPKDAAQHVYIHGHTTLTRTWRWVLLETGVDWLKVNLWRAANSGDAYYSPGKNIFMGTDRMWQEITVVHEAGHHFLEWHADGVMGPNQYCNGVCDGTKNCGHCTWCVEDAEDAWNEGFPTWMGTMVGRQLPQMYGVNPYSMLSFEYLALCGDNTPATFDDPWRNEGPFVALLWDIIDANNEDDTLTPETSGWKDRLTLDTDAIWDVVWGDAPLTPLDFLTGFLGNHLSLRKDVWETARNNGYEIDTQAPPLPFVFSSTSHQPGVASSDGTVDLYWLAAPDDASGIAGHSLAANVGGPVDPGTILSCGDVIQFTTINLPAGTWWFTIRSLDRAGRWSVGYATFGPVIISAPAAAELATTLPPDWAQALVPLPAPNFDSIPPPPRLLAGDAPTWWSLGVANRGTGTTVGDVRIDVRVDGRAQGSALIEAGAPLAAGASRTWLNQGPLVVGGGRHTFGAWADAGETASEEDEGDNHWAWQWLWAPAELATVPALTLGAPPAVTGGWENLVGGAMGTNVDAVRLRVPAGELQGLFLFADDDGADFDLQLHTASDDPQAGLDTWLTSSARLAGQLDAVLVPAAAGEVLADVAILNYSGHEVSAHVGHVAAGAWAPGDDAPVVFIEHEMLRLGTVVIEPGQEGPLTLRVTGDAADGTLNLAWFGTLAAPANLDAWTAHAHTGGDGTARLDVFVDTPGQHAFALYRHPATGSQARTAQLRVAPTLPDLFPVAAAGWAAPLVPRSLPDGLPGDVPVPGELLPAPTATYFNAAAGNGGSLAYPPNPCLVTLDGAMTLSLALPALATGEVAGLNDATPVPVAGGRHTAAMVLDADGLMPEEDDANNAWGAQWVWSPPVVGAGASVVAAPPLPDGGWNALGDPGAAGLAPNCLGFRFGGEPDGRTRAGKWVGFVAVPAAGEDCDVALHEAATGAQDGFSEWRSMSGWPADECDFVLVNYERTTPRAFDAGLRRFAGAGAAAQAGSVASSFLGSDPVGTTAAFALPAVQGLALHEVWLSEGIWRIRLENLDETVDYGLSVHPGNLPWLAKSHVLPNGLAWLAGPGQDEAVIVDVEQAGYLCVAAWKRGPNDWPLIGSYRLVFEANVSGVAEQAPPRSTRFVAAVPNPFNPTLAIEFELERAGPASVDVFDLQGRRVRRLWAGDLEAGRHGMSWDGNDDGGRRLASGAYVLRLTVPGGRTDHRRVTMLK